MKLFVVGEASGNPDDWSIWSELALVVAENAEQALALVDGYGPEPVAEVDMSQPKLLVKMSEPAWGDDL